MFVVTELFMQHKLEWIEVSNDEKSGVISGFMFCQDVLFALIFCSNFGYYISPSLVVCHSVIQRFSGLSS